MLGSFQEMSNGTVDVAAAITWFPLDTDVISLERPEVFKQFYLDRDPTCLHGVARGLVDVQVLYGFAPRVYGKGHAAKRLWDYVRKIKAELEAKKRKRNPVSSSDSDEIVELKDGDEDLPLKPPSKKKAAAKEDSSSGGWSSDEAKSKKKKKKQSIGSDDEAAAAVKAGDSGDDFEAPKKKKKSKKRKKSTSTSESENSDSDDEGKQLYSNQIIQKK